MELRREVVVRRGRRRWAAPFALVFTVVEFGLLGGALRFGLDAWAVARFVPAAPACRALELTATLSAAVVDEWLRDPLALARSGRIVPAMRDGTLRGFELYAIQPASPFAMLGLKNGDLIRRIDGVDVTDRDAELLLWTRLGEGRRHGVLEVERNGCPLAIDVQVL